MPDSASFDADYSLVWPRGLFRSELQALLNYRGVQWIDRAESLLSEAFAGDGPQEDFRAEWSEDVGDIHRTQRGFFERLLRSVDVLPEYATPRPYWADRHRLKILKTDVDPEERIDQMKRDWAALVREFRELGYLDHAAPRACVDDRDPPPPQDVVLEGVTEERIGVAELWPLSPSEWDLDTFYSLVEMVHDLVARPRSRSYHDYAGCGWHYSSFSVGPGQVLYRWRTNRLRNYSDLGVGG